MKRLLIITALVLIAIPGFSQVSTAPANIGAVFSLFFRDVLTREPIAVMASTGYRLPVDAGAISVSVGSITVPVPVLLAPTTGSVSAVSPGASISIPSDGYHLTLSLQTLGATVWVHVGSATVSVAGAGHEQMTFSSDFDVAPSSVVGLISSTTASVAYRIDRR